MATKLSLFSDALLLCGERALSSLSDNVEARRLLDQVYNNGGVDYCLAQGFWPHAMRTQQLDYDPATSPSFGYAYAHSKPSDWVVTAAISDDEYLRTPLVDYSFENGWWYTDVTPIYIRYVSNDASYGYDLGNWDQTFKEFVAAYFASKIVLKVTDSPEKTELVLSMWKRMESEAKSKARMSNATVFPPAGAWVRSRTSYGRRDDRGNNGSLTG